MIRDDLLATLQDLPFALIWPGQWDDIGFTEREIWANSNGYGFISCDEPTGHWEGHAMPRNEWQRIKAKLDDGSLTFCDIQGTVIEELLNAVGYDKYSFCDDEELIDFLYNLPTVSNENCKYFYALQTWDGVSFFDNESEFKRHFERDDADEYWEDMEEEQMKAWLDRLSHEKDPGLIHWSRMHGLIDSKNKN